MSIWAVLSRATACVQWLIALGAAALPASASAQAVVPLPFGLLSEGEFAARMSSEVEPLWTSSGHAPRAERGKFKGVGGVALAYAKVTVPDERGAVIIVTGRTENLLKYQEVVADLVRQKY